jgi:hypothetical protein
VKLLAALGLSVVFLAGLAFAVDRATGRPPDFCVRHPENPNCLTSTTTSTTTTPVPSGPQAFGFSESQGPGSVDDMTDAQLDAHFTAERAAGADFTRLSVDTVNDAQFTNQHSHAVFAGLAVIAVVHANTATGAGVYADRARWAAQTFPGIKIELGNEWNLSGFTPSLAASYQIAAYNSVKSVSSASIVSNGLASYGTVDSGITNPVRYLEEMYANGLAGHYDELGIHPYYYNDGMTAAQILSLTDPYSAWAQLAYTTPSLRSVMTTNGDEDKKITATEWGAPSDDPADGFTAGISQDEQANLMTQGIAMWKTYLWAGDLTVYEYSDIGDSATDRERHFGLVDWDGIPKPALAAFSAAVG